jgi:cysteine synthase
VVESSSGSTAVSEAYFARLLGLPFIAVMPATVSESKRAAIEFQGGRCHLVDDPTAVYAEAARLAREGGGHYLDQFTYAERATDWRGNNNIAESIFSQLRREPHPIPAWLVCSAGTGGTLATLGRFVRYGGHVTRICGGDAEFSVFFDHYLSGDASLSLNCGSRIEGIGRPRVEASFLPRVVDAMVKLPDAASVAAMRWLSERLGRTVGGADGLDHQPCDDHAPRAEPVPQQSEQDAAAETRHPFDAVDRDRRHGRQAAGQRVAHRVEDRAGMSGAAEEERQREDDELWRTQRPTDRHRLPAFGRGTRRFGRDPRRAPDQQSRRDQ